MRKVLKPSFEISQIIVDCVSNMQTGKDKYIDAISVIDEYSERFDEAMNQNRAYELTVHEMVTDSLSKNDMVTLYTNKFAKKGQPGRIYYDKIILAPANGTCPLCGIGQVATLDHYMAKTLYPALAVTPHNLIPACRDCNEVRKSVHFNVASDMTLHPYYDEVQNSEWLVATVISIYPICVRYDINASIQDPELRSRLAKHLEVFELKERYAKKAAEEITAHKLVFQTMLDAGGSDGLRDYLQLLYSSSYAIEINSWRTALYKALMNVEQIVTNGKIAY